MRTVRRLLTDARGHSRSRAPRALPRPWPTALGRSALPGASGQLGDERLSDERTVTRVALPEPDLQDPLGPGQDATARSGRLRWYTEDRAPENYLVLRSKRGPKGGAWLQIRVPRRPNGSKGWVPRRAMQQLRVLTTSLEIDKRALKARLFKDGREVWTSSVGIGASGTPTPSGRYWIRERLATCCGNAAYGPLAFGTAAYSRLSDWPGGGVIGIHGTNAARPHPRPPVTRLHPRARTAKILQLDKLMPVGTPVWIHD